MRIKVLIERHQIAATVIFLVVVMYTGQRHGFADALGGHLVLATFLVPIFFYRVIAYFAGFGFPEYFARDFKSENHPGPYAVFFWLLYLIACAFMVFEWRLY